MSEGAGPRWILLPGMDGIGRFRALREALSPAANCRSLSYPADVPLGYDALTEQVREALRAETDYILVAESFSGPIATRLAAERPAGLRALVFAASFCACPVRGPMRSVLSRMGAPLFRLRPPRFLIRYFLLGPGAPEPLLADVYAAVDQVTPETFALRLHEILRVDDCPRLSDIVVPVLYLQATQDRLVHPAVAESMRAACRHFDLHQIDGPHMVLQRNANESVSAIRAFLARHKLSGSGA